MKMDETAKRLVIGLALALAGVSVAMPTKQELVQAQSLVQALTADDLRALQSKEKTLGDVAAAQLALADKAETEAGKYLLMQGAFRLYARSEDYDSAAEVLQRMRGEIAGLPPEVVVEIVNNEMRRVAADKAPKVLAIFRDAQRTIKCRKRLAAIEQAAKSKPGDPTLQRQLAECHVGLGDWAKALEIFAKLGDEAAKWELGKSKGCDAAKAADSWWNYPTKDAEPFKVHASTIYQKGLDSGKITGLRKTLAEKRVKEMESLLPGSTATGTMGISPAVSKVQADALYCVIDLSAGPTASNYPVKWLTTPPPGGFNTDEYKTTKLVLRRIEPGSFKMGGKYEVTLTKPYYIGIFEMTQKQYKQVTGSNYSRFNDDMRRPVESVSWDMIRGDSTTYNWPTSANVDPSSFMGKMQARTGLNFDLPTEAQWEYACRAGSDGDFGGTGQIDDMGWYKNNSGGRPHPVGQKQANAWGIHDMHGNVGEWCLDWHGNLLGGETDPLGSFSGSRRIRRGSCWCESNPRNCGSSARNLNAAPSSTDSHFGFRLCMSADQRAPSSSSVSRGSDAPAASGNGAKEPPAKVVAQASTPVANGKEIAVKLATGVTLDFVQCPAGSFEMGNSNDEKSPDFKHKVTITRPFWIGKYQVTRGIWAQYSKDIRTSDKKEMYGGNNAAMVDISYHEVLLFCNWLNHRRGGSLPKGYVFRLPTEAEWEYALNANGGNPGNPYIKWRDGDKSVESQIMVTLDDYKRIAEKHAVQLGKGKGLPPMTVGTKAPNDWGIYDMLSNGSEFVLDTVDDSGWTGEYNQDDLKGKGVLLYKESETDPLRFVANVKTWRPLIRGGKTVRGSWYGKCRGKSGVRFGMAATFRLVIGPDLLKERGIKLPKLGK